ncbi:hypothetical protein MNAN1_000049 [Malassezia nana]|uniref:Uncharacterized protein n=1 Tax=Malassezia nana TaxID=180528 RepID=A0AAF0J0K3_9BASI|nr:hypothetical protein MNAN1_000049 [Malassezia nana]
MATSSAPVEAAGPTRQALYLNEVARSLVYHAPAASQRHGASFAKLVPSVVRWGEEASFGRPARVLWGHDTSRPSSHAASANTRSCLPDAYVWANPTCAFCAVPLVPGVNARHAPRSRRRSSEVSLGTFCQTCRKNQRLRKPRTAAQFSSVRRRPPLQQVVAEASRASAPLAPAAKAESPTKAASPVKAAAALAPAAAPAPTTPRVSSSTQSTESSAPRPARQPQASRASASPFDTKAGLRTLFQQKKQKDQAARQQAPPSGGLADFLRQL